MSISNAKGIDFCAEMQYYIIVQTIERIEGK